MSKFEWMDNALCREVGTDIFFPEVGANDKAVAAKRVCNACEVMVPCLSYALSDPSLTGIFGGTTDKDRSKIKRGLL